MVIWLFKKLVGEFPAIDEDSISEAISAAFRYHLRHPENFESAKGLPLEHYLLYSASRFLRTRVSLRKAA